MRAWILDESPGDYRLGEIDPPELGADDVRIQVVASALNHMDLWVTKGMPKPPLPHVPGCDVAGVVDAVGEDVDGLADGDEVVINPGVSPVADVVRYGIDSPMGPGFMIYGEHCWGGHAEFAVAPARNVLARPASRTWEECAAYPLASLTAYRMLRRARVRAGDTVLVVGIGSGVSCAALGLAKLFGARVVATSRSEAKRAEALAMGADGVVDSTADRWDVRADVVIESVGPATWERSIRALAPGGRLVVCGGTSGADRRGQPAAPVLQAVRDHRIVDGQLHRVRRADPSRRSGSRRTHRRGGRRQRLSGRPRTTRRRRAAGQDRAATHLVAAPNDPRARHRWLIAWCRR